MEEKENTEREEKIPRRHDFDTFVSQLQSHIESEEKAVFSEKVIAEYQNPHNVGRMIHPDGFGIIDGWCGDSMEIYLLMGTCDDTDTPVEPLKPEKITIVATSFMTDGCGASTACGSIVARMAEGRSVESALHISQEDVVKALDGLPKENLHCATLAAATLKKALRNYLSSRSIHGTVQ